MIGDSVINLQLPIDDAAISKRPISLSKQYYEQSIKKRVPDLNIEFKDDSTFYLPVMQTNAKTGETSEQGKIRVQIDILSQDQADKNKVGIARDEPNHSPYLAPPVGRLVFTLNPFKFVN